LYVRQQILWWSPHTECMADSNESDQEEQQTNVSRRRVLSGAGASLIALSGLGNGAVSGASASTSVDDDGKEHQHSTTHAGNNICGTPAVNVPSSFSSATSNQPEWPPNAFSTLNVSDLDYHGTISL